MLVKSTAKATAPAMTENLEPDLISSSADRIPLPTPLQLTLDAPPKTGNLVLVRVKKVSSKYSSIEIANGEEVSLEPGKILVGVLGARRALIGFSGDVPEKLEPHMSLFVLNRGGVIGKCTG